MFSNNYGSSRRVLIHLIPRSIFFFFSLEFHGEKNMRCISSLALLHEREQMFIRLLYNIQVPLAAPVRLILKN